MIICDAHVHIYPCYRVESMLKAAVANLRQLQSDFLGNKGRNFPKADGTDLTICLVERWDCNFFRENLTQKGGLVAGDIVVENVWEGICSLLKFTDGNTLYIFAGRQIVTNEGLEVLSLVSSASIPDGLSLEETKEAIIKSDGIYVLNWAPGKWWFKRGKLVRGEVDKCVGGAGEKTNAWSNKLMLGDTTLRPTWWPMSKEMHKVKQHGMTTPGVGLIAGSDPLPFCGEEGLVGTYGLLLDADIDLNSPVVSMKKALLHSGVCGERGGHLIGQRDGLGRFLRRQTMLRFKKINARCKVKQIVMNALIFACFWAPMVVAQAVDQPDKNSNGLPDKLTLQQSIDLAIASNKDLKILTAKAREQDGLLLQAKATNRPFLSGVASYAQNDNNFQQKMNGASMGSDKNWSTALRVDQSVYEGGAGIARTEAQELQVSAVKEQYRALLNDTLFQVKQQFAAVLLAHEKIIVQQQSVELLAEEYRQEKQRYAAGTVSQYNVLTAEVALANGKTPLITAQNEERIAKEQLRETLGFQDDNQILPDVGINLDGQLRYEPRIVILADTIREALANRPELKALELLSRAAQKGVDVEFAGYLPALSVYGSYGLEKDRQSDSLSEFDNGWRIGADLKWSIFDSFLTKGKVDSAKARLAQAQETLSKNKLSIEVEVRRIYSSYTEATELVQASSKVVEQGEENVRLAKSRLSAGVGTQLELLNAQYALTSARTNYVQALYNYIVATAGVDRVTGSAVLAK